MKRLFPLLIVIAVVTFAFARLFLAKEYCLLCFNKGYEVMSAAPDYFTDSFVTALPSLF
jgi:hypothetical protein